MARVSKEPLVKAKLAAQSLSFNCTAEGSLEILKQAEISLM